MRWNGLKWHNIVIVPNPSLLKLLQATEILKTTTNKVGQIR